MVLRPRTSSAPSDREECGEVVEATGVGVVGVRGDGLADGLSRGQLPLLHAVDATGRRSARLPRDGRLQHVVDAATGSPTRGRVVHVDARTCTREHRSRRQAVRHIDVLQRLEREHDELERDAVAPAVGVRHERMLAKRASYLVGSGVVCQRPAQCVRDGRHGHLVL